MLSLLKEDTKTTVTYSNKIEEIENSITKNYNIKYNSNKNNDNEYSLNTHIFNPTKNSPPNDWQNRLRKRINYLHFNDTDIKE
tara:strand:+ start:1758 stop:2006 length:249 start_codon:yes stop_codon:yes gene_type:complete